MRALTLLSLLPSLALAQVPLLTVMAESETAAAEFANMAADLKNDALAGRTAGNLGTKHMEMVQKFAKAKKELDAEKARLIGNPAANRAELERIAKADAALARARQRLDLIQPKLKDTATMIGAAKSGFLERTANEVKAATGEAKDAVAASQAATATPTGDGVASVEVRELKLAEGRVKLFLVSDGKEVELTVGNAVVASGLPILIRAQLLDEKGDGLEKQKSGSTAFEQGDFGCAKGRAYKYGNASGKSEWTAKQKVKWVVTNSDTQARLRGFATKNADPCGEGDVLEFSPGGSTAQGLNFDLSGTTTWQRKSVLAAGPREETVTSKDASVRAFVTISVFGK
ncbi:MAG: hypothetical protein JNM17_29140 [Archangium sp.]|nr:hypothetical protein [Archangium sp.]